MRVIVSAVRPSGHLVIARLPEGAAFGARFPGEDGPRDVTGMVADLLLAGGLDQREATESGRPEPVEQVVAAVVSYSQPPLPGAPAVPASFTWVHLPSGEAGDFTPGEVLPLVSRGISVLITEGVATEAAEGAVPDSPADLDGN